MNIKTKEGFHDELEKLGMDPILAGILAGGLLGGGIGLVGSHALANLILRNKDYAALFAGGAGAVGGGIVGLLRSSKLYDQEGSNKKGPSLGQQGIYGRGPA